MLHDATKKQAELAMKQQQAFMFALKVVSEGLDKDFTEENYSRFWSVLNDVANGTSTLNSPPTEKFIANPAWDEYPLLKKHQQEMFQKQIQTERELAQWLLKARDGFATTNDDTSSQE
jgi:hypothetical protein